MLNLSFQLLRLFADGTLTATSVQLLAAAAKADGWGAADETALKLTGIGAGGKQPNNCLRDLLRLSKRLGIADATPEPYNVSIPGPGARLRNVGVCLPHEQAHMIVSKDGLEKYACSDRLWASDVGVGQLLRQWGDRSGVSPRHVLAIGLHADGVSYSTSNRVGQSRSAAVSAWNFISAETDAAKGKRFPFLL